MNSCSIGREASPGPTGLSIRFLRGGPELAFGNPVRADARSGADGSNALPTALIQS